MAKGFFSQMWRPTVASPAPNTQEAPDDKVLCSKHPPMPPQYLAEGSSKVLINGHPACRSGDRSTCEAVIVDGGLVSDNVRIGGEPIVVREIRSGKTPGIGLAITALMMLRGRGGKFYSKFGCMLMGGAASFVSGQVTGALTRAIVGTPNPVHAATGAKILGGEQELDFTLPALIPLTWQRFYSSLDERHDSLFGKGWSVSYEVCVTLEPDPQGGERLYFTDDQARLIDMGHIAPGEAVFSAGEGLSVRRSLQGELLIEDSNGIYRLFEPCPQDPRRLRLGQLGDRNDNRVNLRYDEQGRLADLSDTFNLVRLSLHYNAQWPRRVAQIVRNYPDGNLETLASYDYDAFGDLAEVRDGEGRPTRHFAYDDNRHMLEHRTSSGLRCSYEWLQIEGEWRVVRHWTSEGDDYQFHYDIAAGLTRVTDSLQRTHTHRWNSQYQIVEHTDALGNTWCFNWSDEHQLLNAIDPKGGGWQYFYDESGNLAQTIDPLGRSESTHWLEHWALPRVQIDRNGNRWQYRYDQRGNCIREEGPLGHVKRLRYDEHGRLIESTDATGRSQTRRWNDQGLMIEQVDCSGFATRYSYDSRGYLQQTLDAQGGMTRYVHDPRGRLVSIERADGGRELFQRAPDGALLAHVNAAGHTTTYAYTPRGQIRLRTDASGRKVAFDYDHYGRLIRLTNENGESYRFSWSVNNHLIQQQDLDGSRRHYRYDPLGNLVQLVFAPAPESAETPIEHMLERDAAGRLKAKITPDGRYDYLLDNQDQLLAATCTLPGGKTTRVSFTYDKLGQLLEEHSVTGTLGYTYDELGNLATLSLPDGRRVNRLMYGSGHLHQLNLDGRVIADFERDRLHREISRTQGRLLCRSDYDLAGRLRSRGSHPGDRHGTSLVASRNYYTYDSADRLVEVEALQSSTNTRDVFGYDATARILSGHVLPDGRQEQFSYDPAANLLDGIGQHTVRHNRLLAFQDKRYRYDGFGRLVEKRSNARGIQHLRYDAEHRLIEVRTRHAGRETVVRMEYDPLGRRTAKEHYDSRDLLLSKTEFLWEGLRLLEERRNGRRSLFLYGDAGHEPLARVDGSGVHQQVLHFHNHLNGLPRRLTSEEGQVVWEAGYRVWGECTWERRHPIHNEEQNLRFQGQYLDRETGLHYNTFRFYDPDTGRFTQPDPIGLWGGLNLYAYAPNPITWIDPLGWDTVLYRSMSMDEYNGLVRTGTWTSNGTMEGKWFAESYKDAVTWGKTMGHGGDFKIVQVKVPDKLANAAFSASNLDSIGKARYIEIADLNRARVKPRWARSISCGK
ncbi:RHS repeat-associated core domain-containing protein [Pseudomonas sp. GD03867]